MQILKNLSASLVANVVSLGVGIISVLIFPKFVGVEDFGYYQLYISYTAYVTITGLGLSDGVYLETGGMPYGKLNKEKMHSIFWLLTVAQVIIYSLLFVVSMQMANMDRKIILCVVCVCAIIIHQRYFLYLLLQATDRIKEYAYIIITERITSVVGGLILLLVGYRGYVGLILMDLVGRLVSLILAMHYCKDIVCGGIRLFKVDFQEIKKYILSGSMLLFSTLTSSLVIGIVRYAIDWQWDIETFSKISLTISISNMAVRCINAVGIVMFPFLRKMEDSKLAKTYENLNVGLMSFIFCGLILYQPAAYLLKLWLPQYADSVRYAAILLPMCAYECKNVMLISTYLKTIRAERQLLFFNLISVGNCLFFTVGSVFLLKSIELAVLSILISLMLRCIFGELYIGKKMNLSVQRNIVLEGGMVIVFVISNFFLGWKGTGVYIMFALMYVYAQRKEISDIWQIIKTNVRKI